MKQYTKPQIIFEDFSLSVNINAGCGLDTGYARDTCTIYDAMLGVNVFDSNINSSCVPASDGNMCYHNPTEDAVVYVS